MITFDSRTDMLSLVPKNGSYAEIGVFKAQFSEEILKRLDPKHLVLIDLFTGVIGSGNQDGNNFEYVDLDTVYRSRSNRH